MQHFMALGSTCADNRHFFGQLNSVLISAGHDSDYKGKEGIRQTSATVTAVRSDSLVT